MSTRDQKICAWGGPFCAATLRSGPFAWNGLQSFWVAAGAFFVWLVAMTPLTLHAIDRMPHDTN